MAEGIVTLTDATFDETVGAADEPVLVDFWAEWCGPCKMIAPILDEIAGEQAGKLTIAKLNVDDNPDIATRFDVMSIPTLIVFKDGEAAQAPGRRQGQGPAARRSSTSSCTVLPADARVSAARPSATCSAGSAPPGFRPGRRRGRRRSAPRTEHARPRVPGAPGPARRRHLRRADLGRAGRGRLALGDRLLYLTLARSCAATTSPSCSAGSARLGFDAGRVDGIFGPRTARALQRLPAQRGLTADGICGPTRSRALDRLRLAGPAPGRASPPSASASGCAPARRRSPGRRVVVGQFGGLERAGRDASRRALRPRGRRP